MRTSIMTCALLTLLGLAACSRPEPAAPIRVRMNEVGPEVGAALEAGRPVILELQQGDVLPLRFSIDGNDLATPKDLAPIPLIAKRHFFVRISPDGLEASDDGVTFVKPKTPGSFRIGLRMTKEGTAAEIEIRTPRR